jgi:hypothetical protein
VGRIDSASFRALSGRLLPSTPTAPRSGAYLDYVVEGTFRLMKGPETLPMNVLIQIRSTRFVRATRW